MLKIAITGNIASGKSTVEKIITDMGFTVIDADVISHNLLENDNETIANIKNTFKTHDILDENNNISRRKLGEVVFRNDELKSQLEMIIHPKVKTEIEKYYTKLKNEDLIFVSIALLFEAKFDKDFDKIILVTADENTRKSRLIERNGYSIEHANARILSQMPQEEKVKKSDYIIDNNSDFSALCKTTEDVILILKTLIL